MSSWVKFISKDMRSNLISMLSGDVKKIEELINASNNNPIPIASVSWGEELIIIDSYLFSYVLFDALMFSDDEKDYRDRNIPELLDLHKRMCGEMKHPDYGNYSFVSWNDWSEEELMDEDEIALLKEDGAKEIDIELTIAGYLHHEEKVIDLLRRGASPYFINRTDAIDFEEKGYHYGYFEVSMLLCHLDSEWCDQWDLNGLTTLLRKDIITLNDSDLELIVFDLFNAAASQRILYLVDKYITDEARAIGEELMRKYDAYFPILRRRIC